jgi:hypothetical protein
MLSQKGGDTGPIRYAGLTTWSSRFDRGRRRYADAAGEIETTRNRKRIGTAGAIPDPFSATRHEDRYPFRSPEPRDYVAGIDGAGVVLREAKHGARLGCKCRGMSRLSQAEPRPARGVMTTAGCRIW